MYFDFKKKYYGIKNMDEIKSYFTTFINSFTDNDTDNNNNSLHIPVSRSELQQAKENLNKTGIQWP